MMFFRIDDLLHMPSWNREQMEEVAVTMSALEKRLSESLQMIHVQGKRGSRVPIIIPEDCVLPIRFITEEKLRTKHHIHPGNNYVFANSGCA